MYSQCILRVYFQSFRTNIGRVDYTRRGGLFSFLKYVFKYIFIVVICCQLVNTGDATNHNQLVWMNCNFPFSVSGKHFFVQFCPNFGPICSLQSSYDPPIPQQVYFLYYFVGTTIFQSIYRFTVFQMENWPQN